MDSVRSRLITVLAVLAAVLYNSWPLGYVLNPQVARAGLSSDLEAYGQPYAWFFAGADVVSSILVVWAVLYLFRGRVLHSIQADLLSLGLFFFGLMTAASALLPLRCGRDIETCGYRVGQTFGLHDLFGVIAALGLFLAMCIAWRVSARNRKRAWVSGATLFLWSFWGVTFLLTPLPFVQRLSNLQSLAVTWQHVFLILSGIGIVVSLRNLEYLNSREDS